MKGLILAGGMGTRLQPTSRVVNKHLFMVGDKPLIFYPIEALRDAGVTDITISLGEHQSGAFFELLRNGEELGVDISYHYHGEPKGIAYAINCAKSRIGDEPFIVHLGDNIFCDGLKSHVDYFKRNKKPMVLLKNMQWIRMKNFGVLWIKDGDKNTMYLEEKPQMLPMDYTGYAVLGAYFLDKRFFKIFDSLKPSPRGEYEIIHALREYDLDYRFYKGKWFDCGTPQDMLLAGMWRMRE